MYSGCISGAFSVEEVKVMLTQSGFTNVVKPKDESKAFIKDLVPGANVQNYILSGVKKGIKP
jgi:arsenite methyltransferase